ncbi:MAG: hypothetical protein D3909_03045, partial [Candidatus Electrothrix sp. ATG1]|nr:hypothetical protein [Candidatus Electrothrix sp. ATG1]
MTKLINLHRTFTPAKELKEEQGELVQHLWGRNKTELTWDKLYENAVTVVVGEAGIGKTKAFENERGRLQKQQGEAAFFVELNRLSDINSWELVVTTHYNNSDYTVWSASSDIGYFFLDAIDESRLKGHSEFKTALSIVSAKLKPYLSRIKVIISSRWTDWGQKEVQDAVTELLVKPINQQAEPFVVSLNPLSETEAKRFASEKDVENGEEFWRAINHGNYWHMATRPLDLEWLVALWNQKKKFGSYLKLIEGNVTNRLTETNPNYKTSDKIVLSPEKLRHGVEELAAAAEFSGSHHIATASQDVLGENEVAPLTVLTDWSEPEIMRLLASAIFDEATYGRVKFHHRPVREYLVACWVKRKIEKGWPVQEAINLFAAAPFGELVLIPSRRWALCWLAAINANVREWMTNNFPEMIAFDGDPESWDELSADRAFTAYLQRLENGLRIDWHNDASEYRRVGRRLPSGRIASLLAEPNQLERVRLTLFSYAKFARLTDCAKVAFSIYQDEEKSDGDRGWALLILEEVGTQEQRAAIKDDLLSGKLATNELIAAALPVIDWKNLSVEQLSGILKLVVDEDYYEFRPMTRCLKYSLLPVANDTNSAELLLSAIITVLPQPAPEKRFHRREMKKTWASRTLPHCFINLLELFPKDSIKYPQTCIDAAEHIESLSNNFQDNDVWRLQDLIVQHSILRWKIALELPDIKYSLSKAFDCIVTFDWNDLPELTKRANDLTLTESERNIWFRHAFKVVFYTPAGLRNFSRSKAIQALVVGPEKTARQKHIEKRRLQHISSQKKERAWRSKERRKKREERQENKTRLLADVEQIRDGSSNEALQWLIRYSFKHSTNQERSRVDLELIKKDFGQDIADALTAGMKRYWRIEKIATPDEHNLNGTRFKESYLLAAVTAESANLPSFNQDEISRAAYLAVWEQQNSLSWFERLAEIHSSEVCKALHPWIVKEAKKTTQVSRTIVLALR